jgi:integrase
LSRGRPSWKDDGGQGLFAKDVGKAFETYLKGRGRTDDTIQRYVQLAQAFTASVGPKRYGRNDLHGYLAELREKGVGRNYLRFVIYGLKDYFRYLEVPWPLDRSDVPKGEEPKRPFFNLERTVKILSYVDTGNVDLRNRCIFHVAAEAGPRRSELRGFDREDVSFKDGTDENCKAIYVRPGKRNKPGWRPLSDSTLALLREYLDGRKDDLKPLFLSPRGDRLCTADLSYIFHSVVDKVFPEEDLHGYGWHTMRRGLVTMLGKNVSTKEKQEFLGWLTPTMPMIYEQLERGEVEAHVRRIHPLFEKKEERK